MTRDALRLTSSLLSYFDVPWLEAPEDDDATAAFLLADCDRVSDANGASHWALRESVRRSVVAETPPAVLHEVWRALPRRPDDHLQWAIDELLEPASELRLDDLSAQRLRALESAARWLGGAGRHDHREIRRAVRMHDLRTALAAVASEQFVGRRALRSTLRNALHDSGPPMLIHGFGGVGKSAVVARHLLDAMEHENAVVAYLSFDHSALDATRPGTLVQAMADQLRFQVDRELAPQVEALARDARDRVAHESTQATVSTRSLQVRHDDIDDLLDRLATLTARRPYVIALDTVEEAQRQEGAVRGLARFVRLTGELLPRAQLVLSGRAPVPKLGVPEIPLEGLERPEAIDLLRHLLAGGPDDIDLGAVVDQVGTSPLCLRLASGLLRQAPRDDDALRDLSVARVGVEGELYRRLLGHIEDPDVRKLAHPGLTLRRITPQIIQAVLAGPCGIAAPSPAEAERLFAGLAREAMLVERAPEGGALLHRPDVRRMMLPRLAREMPEVVNRIHRAAVRYYDDAPDVVGRTEGMYHRLMLERRPATLDKHWNDELAPGLLPAIDELPPASRAYLAARVPGAVVDPEDLHHAGLSDARRLLARRVASLIGEGQALESLEAIDAHMAEKGDDDPVVMDLRLQALELTGRFDEAATVAEGARRRAGRVGSTDDLLVFTLHAARIAERRGSADEAEALLRSTTDRMLTFERTEHLQLAVLRLLTARLALIRREQWRVDHDAVSQALELVDALPARLIRGVPGLLRELAVELGHSSPRLVQQALHAEGVNVSRGRVAEALARVEQASGTSRGPLRGVAGTTSERGEGGDLVATLIDELDASSSELVLSAVLDDYATETEDAIAYEQIPLARPVLGSAEEKSVLAVLRSGLLLSRGEHAAQFERAFARLVEAPHTSAVSSGHAGLHLAIRAAGVTEGDEVVTSPLSVAAVANAIGLERATPVFVDVDPVTFTVDPDAVAQAVTPRTAALLPVHTLGYPADVARLERHGLPIVEYAGQALGARFRDGTPVGSSGHTTVFDFNAVKQLTTGEGGMIAFADATEKQRVDCERNEGFASGESWIDHERLGFNYRLGELPSALGVAQLGHLEAMLADRRRVAGWYRDALAPLVAEIGLTLPHGRQDDRCRSWFTYVVQVSREHDRDAVVRRLTSLGIQARPGLRAMHLTRFSRERYGTRKGMFPVCEDVAARSIAIPFFPAMRESQVERVVNVLTHALVS